MNRILHLASLIAATICATASIANAQSGPPPARNDPAEERAVLAVVQRMFDAMRTKDTATFREIFEPNARLVGMRTRQSGEQVLQAITWERFGAYTGTAAEIISSACATSNVIGVSNSQYRGASKANMG